MVRSARRRPDRARAVEKPHRRPVGEREAIHLGKVDETGAKGLEVRFVGVHKLRQVVPAGKIDLFHYLTRPH